MDLVGQQIGNYIARSELGRGGMGVVYLAEHPLIGRKVAIKVLHEELAINEQMVQRLWLEAKSASEIESEHIAEVLDFGRVTLGTSGGETRETVYLVMELLTGRSLADLFWNDGISFSDAVDVARQLCRALEASHSRGIIHRDLKPENVFIMEREGRKHFVKVLDFGIAKLLANPYTRTRTGVLLGTPAYMSPEQCRGSGEVDHRSDIYSLGVMLYELTTGTLPFAAQGFGDVLVAQMTRLPEPPSSHNPRLPRSLETIILCALEKAPENRFQSMAAFGAALGSVAEELRRSAEAAAIRGSTRDEQTTERDAAGGPGDAGVTLMDPPAAELSDKIMPKRRDLHALDTQAPDAGGLHHRATQMKDGLHAQTTMLKDPRGGMDPGGQMDLRGQKDPSGPNEPTDSVAPHQAVPGVAAARPAGGGTEVLVADVTERPTLMAAPGSMQPRAELNQRLKGVSLRDALGSTGAVRQLESALDAKGAPQPLAPNLPATAAPPRSGTGARAAAAGSVALGEVGEDDEFLASERRRAQLRMMVLGGVVLLAAVGILLALR